MRAAMMRGLAAWKWLLSFRKKTWDVSDYPIRIIPQDVTSMEADSRRKPIAVSAMIFKWGLVGMGDTREEALADLRERFRQYRESHDALPRPGTRVPLVFASTVLIDQHRDIARDFLQRIFHLDIDECFISDESSLWDFHSEETNDALYRKIAIIYGVDVADVPEARLAGIFERLAQR